MWQAMVGCFECSARFFAYIHSLFVLTNIIYQLYTKQRTLTARLTSVSIGNLRDLGSIPRSPSYISYFCQNVFQRSTASKDHHASSPPSLPRAQEVSSKGQNMDSTMNASQPFHTRARKSNGLLAFLGLIASKASLWVQTPPWFAQSFKFFSFVFFLFILLIVF